VREHRQYFRRPGDRAIRRSRARKGLLRRLVSLGAQAAVLGAAWLAGRWIYRFCTTTPAFAVRTIAVRGNQRAKTADIVALSTSVLSENIFRADLVRLREEICRSPWVLDATVRRSLPGTIEVTVTERKPAAIVGFEGGLWLVDASGRRLAEYAPEVAGFDFPVLTGIDNLPRVEAVKRIRAGAAAAGALGAARPDLAKTVSEIDLSEPDRIGLRPADGSPVLFLDTKEYLRNLENYAAIRNQIGRTLKAREDLGPRKVAWVDLRFRGRIAVMTALVAEKTGR